MNWGTFKPFKSDGSMPAGAAPCSEFQLRHFVHWELDIAEVAGFAMLDADWEWGIQSAGAWIFHQTVHVGSTLTYFGAPGAEIITWWYDDAAERISTLLPEKPPILGDDEDAWTLRTDGTWDNPAEQGLQDQDAEGGSLTDGQVIIEFWWDSPVYQIPLPSDAMMKFGFHRVPATWPVRYNDCGIRSVATSISTSCCDAPGFIRMPVGGSTKLLQIECWGDGQSARQFRITPGLNSPILYKDDCDRLFCAGWKARAWTLLMSDNNGTTWTTIPMDIWPTSATDIDQACLADGTHVSIAKISGALYFKSSRDNFSASYLVDGSVKNRCMLPRGGRHNPLFISDGKDSAWVSYNEGQSWAKTTLVVG